MRRTFLLLLLLLILPMEGPAQEDTAGYTALYRGSLPKSYPFRYNGTYFWNRKAFQPGFVWYNGKQYDNVLVNVDAYSGELLVCPQEGVGTVVAYRDQVAWFTMDGVLFVNLRYLGYPEAPEGYFEVLVDGQVPLLRQVVKRLRSDGGTHNGDAIGYDDPQYDADVPTYFLREERYFALEDGRLVKIRKRNYQKRLRQDPGVPVLAARTATWHSTTEKASQGTMPEVYLPEGSRTRLPDGYFDERKEDTTTVRYAGPSILATYRNKVYTIGQAGNAEPGKRSVTGTVSDAESGEPMYGVVIYDEKTGSYTRSDRNGRYRLDLPEGENILHFSAESKEETALRVMLLSAGSLDVMMVEKQTVLKGAVVSAESMANHRRTEMGLERVSVKTLNKIPTAFGEGDVLKAVLTLPGVKTVGEASGGFNVRGGSSDQNLILFNENTIYNPTHLFGIFSSFNPDIVEHVELYKSSIPAAYGGRVSSVLNVRSKEGDKERWKGSLDIGLLTSRGHIEGPLVKGRTTLVAGVRTSYSDWLLKRLPKNSAYAGGGASFTDANLGITHRIDPQNTLQASAYFATDRFAFSSDTTFHYQNLNASLTWKHRTEDNGVLQVSAGYDQFSNRVGVHAWEYGAYDLDTDIRQAFLKANRTQTWNEAHALSYGGQVLAYALVPGTMNPYGESLVTARSLDRERALEAAAFASDNWTLTEALSVEGGLRFSGFRAGKDAALYGAPEFRVSGKYSPKENLSFKGGVNTMQQYIHLISNTSAISPMDTWKLCDASVKPTSGWQAAVGAYWTHLGSGIDFSAETYYKHISRHLDYKAGATLSMNDHLADDLIPVYARAYGMELMMRKPAGRLTGWLSYSYSRARFREMQDRGHETIAGGGWYNAPYDKPHEVKFAGNYALTHRYSISVNIDYSSGRPVTVPYGMYYYKGQFRMAYSERNAYRIPDYFRTDVALNIDPGHYLKALMHASITLGVYNVTGRKNPYSVFFRANSSGSVDGYMLSVFATQIPYINLNLLF